MSLDFRNKEFLQQHIDKTMAFYHPRCVDSTGGFYQFFKDNGEVYDNSTRHLVSSTRFVFNYAMAYLNTSKQEYLELVNHGIDYLERVHKQPNGGYAWLIENGEPSDLTNHCYGLAFVLLANAMAHKSGVKSTLTTIEHVWQLLEQKYYQAEYSLYLDEYDAKLENADKYRGQNANMHMCEALLMCFEATKDNKFLDRAYTLAHTMTVKQADLAQGLVWEHYDSNWQIDWDYNKENPKHLFRPWGFQPGHQTEWTKLLLILNRHKPETWMVEKAKFLFDEALKSAWDEQHGGICYGFAPDKSICDGDKYFWVQAESFAAAALLALATNEEKYWQWYDKIWHYSWEHMIDHQYGAWYRILTQDNRSYSDEKSPAGKTDYHTMGACYEVLRAYQLQESK
ncbi:AGE family epimerase/isomerase [Pseudoalteromonas luteoviolacea]|uniref:N-acylglucosamine 2-epimerase n=1 Tax=Pseudoalteromonas luteoviolacea NCIMB 1942 TaxID=1365253 RepID=A0A167CFS5_9GAMM|nr:AGE family epimerase/isomerase [Pseudoalteromonas luteoviolacea]KZN47611.1 N-acylglucosamine 2-epimerase [Pseudoalteromonas luteoviolacea NCIMB 1942]